MLLGSTSETTVLQSTGDEFDESKQPFALSKTKHIIDSINSIKQMRKAKNISSYLCGAADLNGVTICCCKDIEKICQEVAAYGDLQITAPALALTSVHFRWLVEIRTGSSVNRSVTSRPVREQRQEARVQCSPKHRVGGRKICVIDATKNVLRSIATYAAIFHHYAAIPAETTTSVLFLTTALPPIFERTEILTSLVLNGLLFFVICILMCKICQCCCFLERQDDEDDEGGDKSVHGSTRATPIPLDGGISCPNMVIPPFMEGTAQAQVQNASQPTSTAANPAFAFIAARPTSQPGLVAASSPTMLSLLCQILIAFVLNVGILYVILTVCQPKKCPSAQQKVIYRSFYTPFPSLSSGWKMYSNGASAVAGS
ncbi:unnamed protein product [Toxocara canis]|uniref:Uncharacterized protein n=1 Tax=Toxocara canis TaxID=6265 RepID=A0A183UIP3_TOXCA|nr:unnamed protein product [Toxocara canis]